MKVNYTRAALKDVKKIKDQKLKKKLKEILINLKEAESLKGLKNLKKMVGHPYAYRIRIGDYRLGFYFEDNSIDIARFLKRDDIHKVFPK